VTSKQISWWGKWQDGVSLAVNVTCATEEHTTKSKEEIKVLKKLPFGYTSARGSIKSTDRIKAGGLIVITIFLLHFYKTLNTSNKRIK
jgi:hypothetical protein